MYVCMCVYIYNIHIYIHMDTIYIYMNRKISSSICIYIYLHVSTCREALELEKGPREAIAAGDPRSWGAVRQDGQRLREALWWRCGRYNSSQRGS